MWCKTHKLYTTESASLDFKMWDWAGRHVLQAASIGDEAAIGFIKPWRLTMDLLKQLQREQNTRVTEGAPWTPAERSEETQALGEPAGGVAAAVGVQGSKMVPWD